MPIPPAASYISSPLRPHLLSAIEGWCLCMIQILPSDRAPTRRYENKYQTWIYLDRIRMKLCCCVVTPLLLGSTSQLFGDLQVRPKLSMSQCKYGKSNFLLSLYNWLRLSKSLDLWESSFCTKPRHEIQ